MSRLVLALLVSGFCLFQTASLQADVIELDNGDVIHGTLLKIDEKTLRISNEILGEVNIPRARVHAIVLGHPTKGKRIKPDGSEAEQETPKQIIDRLVNKEFGPDSIKQLEKGAKRQPTPQDAVDQLRREGVDPELKRQLHMLLPGFGTPEVQGYFNSRVDGLMAGTMNIQNIRNDAINARDQLQEIMDDLGQDGVALRGYFSILDNFIKKTEPLNGEKAIPQPEDKPGAKPGSTPYQNPSLR